MTRAFYSAPGRENATTRTEYATVAATLANWTDGAVLVTTEKATTPVWVPRRALAGVSQARINRASRGDHLEIEVELSMALEKNLV